MLVFKALFNVLLDRMKNNEPFNVTVSEPEHFEEY